MIHLEPGTFKMDIQIEGNIHVHNAQIAIRRRVSFDPNLPVILLVGSALEFEGSRRNLAATQQLAHYAAHVAQSIARLGFSIINGACPGLPDTMMLDYKNCSPNGLTIGISAYATPSEHTSSKPFAKNGFPLSADLTLFTGSSFEFLNIINTKFCDAVVVLGGGLGSLIEAATAVEEEVPVYCITPSGGIASRLDSLLKDFIASFKSYNAHEINTIAQLEKSLSELYAKHDKLSMRSRCARLIEQIAMRQHNSKCCIVDIEKGLSRITYSVGELSVAINQPPCLIDRSGLFHTSDDAEVLMHALENYDRKYMYDGLELVISHNELKSVWGPSFDTLMLAETLTKHVQRPIFPIISELGCGSGFLSAWCIKHLQPQQIQLIDSSPEAIACAQRLLIDRTDTVEISYYLATLSTESTPATFDFRPADLVICNPPYLPFAMNPSRTSDAFSGISLLSSLLNNYQHYVKTNGKLLFTVSSISLSDSTVNNAISRLRNNNILVLIKQERVPFKIGEAIINSKLMDQLCREGSIIANHRKSYKYWHDVYIFEIDRNREVRQ